MSDKKRIELVEALDAAVKTWLETNKRWLEANKTWGAKNKALVDYDRKQAKRIGK